jgi:hypothetical protein
MLVTIHQPHYLPWLGYMHRMARADVFVILDHVQFERGNGSSYQNRTRYRMHADGHCEPRWLTVPVAQRSHTERILDKEADPLWRSAAHASTLRHAYREAPYLDAYWPALKALLAKPWQHLVDLNIASIELLREALDIRTPLVRSSTLQVSGAKSELIIDICRALEADTFLGGLGGTRRYLDADAFERAGIRVEWQSFQHPVHPQCGPGAFMPGLSSLDLLFNCGPASRAMLRGAGVAEAACA